MLANWTLDKSPFGLGSLGNRLVRVISTATLTCVPGLPMATKTPTRPKQRQSTQKRSWQNLTDRRKLRHLENTLDKAITKALHEGGIESHEDFKAYVESFSERSGKAPITVELCEGGGSDDDIKGYRFYLTSDPSHRTSGKYLIKNLEGITDKEENYFTPSNIAELFEFDDAELDVLADALADGAFDLDDELDEELDGELDASLDEDLDSDLDELDEKNRSTTPAVTRSKTKTSAKTQSKTQPKAQAKSQGKSSQSSGRNFRYRDPLEEASRFSASAATTGRETNGVNLTGLVGQLATLGVVVGQGVLEELAVQDDEKRIERIIRELQRQNEQVDDLASRLPEVMSSDSSKSLIEPQKTEVKNPLVDAVVMVGSKVNDLGVKLDSDYQSQPIEIDREASIGEQLDQIEASLKVLAKRLDRLEAAVSRLEKQRAEQMHNPTAESEEISENGVQSNPSSQTSAKADVLEQLMSRRASPQQAACADALVGFSRVAHELLDESTQVGIAISSNKALQVDEQENQVAIALNNTQGKTLFAGTRTDGQWTIAEDYLSPDEKSNLCKLPQSNQEYATKASAQALVATFQEKLPERFSGESDPIFTWTDRGKAKYEFEVVTLPNGTQLLQGFDPNRNDQQVFDAMLVPGQPPDILQCSIPLREMEAVLHDQPADEAANRNPEHDSSKRATKAKREELQV